MKNYLKFFCIYLLITKRNTNYDRRIISIITYPILLLIITMTVRFLLNNVVPMFIDIFTESNIDLPKVTAMLIDMSTFLKKIIYILFYLYLWFHF